MRRGNNRAQRQSSTTAAESERQRQAKTNQQQSSDKGSNTPSTTRPQNDVVADDGNISTECAPATMTTIETSPTIDETVSSNRSPPGHETSISRKSQQLNERGCPIGNNFGGMIKSQSGPQRPQRSGSSKDSTPSSRSSTGPMNSNPGSGSPYQQPLQPYRSQESNRGINTSLRSPSSTSNMINYSSNSGIHPRLQSTNSFNENPNNSIPMDGGGGGGGNGRRGAGTPSWRRSPGSNAIGMNQISGRYHHSNSGQSDETMMRPVGNSWNFRGSGGRGLRNIGTLSNPNQMNMNSNRYMNEPFGGWNGPRRPPMVGGHPPNIHYMNNSNIGGNRNNNQDSSSFNAPVNGMIAMAPINGGHPQMSNPHMMMVRPGGNRDFHYRQYNNNTSDGYQPSQQNVHERFNHYQLMDWLKERSNTVFSEYRTRSDSSHSNNLADGSSGIHLYESPQQTLVHTPKEDFFVQLQNAVAPHYLYPQFHTGPATIVVNDMNEFQRYQMVTAPGYPGPGAQMISYSPSSSRDGQQPNTATTMQQPNTASTMQQAIGIGAPAQICYNPQTSLSYQSDMFPAAYPQGYGAPMPHPGFVNTSTPTTTSRPATSEIDEQQ